MQQNRPPQKVERLKLLPRLRSGRKGAGGWRLHGRGLMEVVVLAAIVTPAVLGSVVGIGGGAQRPSGGAARGARRPGARAVATDHGTVPLAPYHATVTLLECRRRVRVGGTSPCVITVTDLSPAAYLPPRGVVRLETDSPGRFHPTECTLTGVIGHSRCRTGYVPEGVGGGVHHLSARYIPSSPHKGSSGAFGLEVKVAGTVAPEDRLKHLDLR